MHFNPKDENLIDRLKGLLPLEQLGFEFLRIFGSVHRHQIHRLKVNVFDNFFKHSSIQDLCVLVFLKGERSGVVPSFDNDIELLLNSSFLLGTLDELVDLIRVFEKLKVNNVTEAEFGVISVNNLAANTVKAFPMARLHELGVKLGNERPNNVHVLDSVVQSLEGLVVLDVLVLNESWGSLVCLHVFEESLKVIGIDIVPKGFLPGLELAVNDGDEIPHLLKLN